MEATTASTSTAPSARGASTIAPGRATPDLSARRSAASVTTTGKRATYRRRDGAFASDIDGAVLWYLDRATAEDAARSYYHAAVVDGAAYDE